MALDVKEIYAWGILGCGWLGQGLCHALRPANVRVWGTGRAQKTLDAIAQSGGTPVPFDAKSPRQSQPPWPPSHTLLVSWPPSAGISAFQEAAKCGRIQSDWTVLISSTSVYPGEAGDYRESDATRRVSPHSGQCLLDIEKEFDSERTTILRAGGLFGPGRNPKNFLRGRKPDRLDEAVNMVHLTDVIRAVRFASEHRLQGAYNVVAPQTVTREVFYHAAGVLTQHPNLETNPKGRKVTSHKIMEAGFTFEHPNPAQACREIQSESP